ncbi:MAG TPA: LytTR family DNA-binding domain-containing protein [Sphingomicrobium sp.]
MLVWAIMQRPDTRSDIFVRYLREPLSGAQFAIVLATSVLTAFVYCQIYCLVAYPPINHMPMTLQASLPWSVATIVPWITCIELSKRLLVQRGSLAVRRLNLGLLFVAAGLASIVIETALDWLLGMNTRALPRQVAAQIPSAAITFGLLSIGSARQWKPVVQSGPTAAPLAEILGLSDTVRWIEAAGNYVEVHSKDGSSLHRVTMRELEGHLDPARFRRIHRSAIVNLRAIDGRVLLGSSPAVRLADGTLLKIGSRYAGNLG